MPAMFTLFDVVSQLSVPILDQTWVIGGDIVIKENEENSQKCVGLS